MRKILFLISALLAFISYSCEENISSKAPSKEDYIMYCVINMDTTSQTAYIASSYIIDGFDPLENKIDPALEDAIVNVKVGTGTAKKEYVFQSAETERNDTSRYKTPFKYYFCNNFKIEGGDSVNITVILKNGKIINSSSFTPYIDYLYFETSSISYDPALTDANHPGVSFVWRFLGGWQMNTAINYFIPRLDIIYSTTDNPTKKIRAKVPKYFNQNGSVSAPVYPAVFTGTNILFYQDSIEKIMASISEGDPRKSRYIIHQAEFTLLLMDRNVASYVAAENTFNDEFSIRIDATDFNNVRNGIGMFGTYASKKAKVKIADWFIKSYGYQVGN
jgi:hypothetical protein